MYVENGHWIVKTTWNNWARVIVIDLLCASFLCTFLPNNMEKMRSIIELIESIIECERAIA